MGIQTVGHLLIAVHFWYGCYYDWNYVIIPKELVGESDSQFDVGKLKFLTYWDAILQSIFFTICFLNDILGTNEQQPKKTPFIRKLKDILLPCLAFPVAMFVGLSFWGLYALDRNLIFPEIMDSFFPAWLNQLMHTNVMIFILLEMLVSSRKYPSRKVGISVLLVFVFSYLVWLHVIHSHTQKWVYPILNVLNFAERVVFFISNFFMIVALYLLGEKINSLWWERKSNKQNSKTSNKKQK